MGIFVGLTGVALVALLVAERAHYRPGVWVAKPLASTGFIAVALAAGPFDGSSAVGHYGAWVLAGLVLSWWGDVFLIPAEKKAVFRAGILAFLLGHVAYVVAFARRGLDTPTAVGVGLAVAVVAAVVLRWLRRHVTPDMVAPVYAYVVVISAMVVCAAATVVHRGQPAILLGAMMFYVSDLAVARDRFVAPGFSNRAWGLPLYYGGQLVLASTLAG